MTLNFFATCWRKKIIPFFLQNDVTKRRGRLLQIFFSLWRDWSPLLKLSFERKNLQKTPTPFIYVILEINWKYFLSSPQGGARVLKLRLFYSESKLYQAVSTVFFQKKITPNCLLSFFHSYSYKACELRLILVLTFKNLFCVAI